jgi:hypothetical protein
MGATQKDLAMLTIYFHYSFFKIDFLKDSPFRSTRCDELTNLSKIASAIVPSPIMSYHVDTGICEDTIGYTGHVGSSSI